MTATFRIFLGTLLASASFAVHAAECDSPAGARQTVERLDADIAAIKAQQKKQQAELTAEIDAITKKMLDDGRWSKHQTGKIYMEIMQSPTYSGLEKKKMGTVGVYVDAARAYAGYKKQGDMAAACNHARAMLFSQSALSSFSKKQFEFMRDSARRAAEQAVKNP